MADNLIVSLQAVFPLFVMMAVGYVIRRAGLVDEYSLKKMNSVCFKVFMACMMFNNIYNIDLSNFQDADVIVYTCVSVVLCLILVTILVNLTEKDRSKRGVLVQAMFRANFVVLGLPLVTNIYGKEGALIPSLLTAIVVPFFNITCVILLTYFNGKERPAAKMLVKKVFTNPYIIAALIAFAFKIVQLDLPDMVRSVVKDMAGVANPLALLILGASFNFSNVPKYKKDLVYCCVMRLIVVPLVFVLPAVFMGFRGVGLMSILAVFATPTAISSHVMTQELGGDADLCGAEVVTSTALSIITLFIWIFCFKSFGLLPA